MSVIDLLPYIKFVFFWLVVAGFLCVIVILMAEELKRPLILAVPLIMIICFMISCVVWLSVVVFLQQVSLTPLTGIVKDWLLLIIPIGMIVTFILGLKRYKKHLLNVSKLIECIGSMGVTNG